MSHDEFPSIDPQTLDAVTGGAAATAPTASSPKDAQVTAALQGILSSLKEVGSNNNNNGSNSLMQMLPFLLMMRGRSGGGGPSGCCR